MLIQKTGAQWEKIGTDSFEEKGKVYSKYFYLFHDTINFNSLKKFFSIFV